MKREEALKIAKPILFNAEMVEAIQNGTKTVTRRAIKHRYKKNEREFFTATIAGTLFFCYSDEEDEETRRVKAPYQVGDILYVRETWGEIGGVGDREYIYRADDDMGTDRWHPSIHMPKEAARIFLRVTGVRVERLQDITDEQAIAEGIRIGIGGEPYFSCRDAYAPLWNSTVKKSYLDKYGWNANPWVFVIEFESVEVLE